MPARGQQRLLSVADPCVASLLDLGFCVAETSAPLETLTNGLNER